LYEAGLVADWSAEAGTFMTQQPDTSFYAAPRSASSSGPGGARSKASSRAAAISAAKAAAEAAAKAEAASRPVLVGISTRACRLAFFDVDDVTADPRDDGGRKRVEYLEFALCLLRVVFHAKAAYERAYATTDRSPLLDGASLENQAGWQVRPRSWANFVTHVFAAVAASRQRAS
jgi:hypothetical protein